MPKNTTQCPQPGLEPGVLVPESSALTMRPPRPHNTVLLLTGHSTTVTLCTCIPKGFGKSWLRAVYCRLWDLLPPSVWISIKIPINSTLFDAQDAGNRISEPLDFKFSGGAPEGWACPFSGHSRILHLQWPLITNAIETPVYLIERSVISPVVTVSIL